MRIIAGDFKGRRLKSPENNNIRPTTDKVKEALFSILNPNISGSVLVDLFAGTGNLGLEGLSRGARICYFCDNSRESISIIKENISHCQAQELSRVYAGDFRKCLDRIKEAEDKADIFLIDPPYDNGLYEKVFQKIGDLDLLADDGLIVAEHRRDSALADSIACYEKIKERRYGQVMLSIYAKVAKEVD